VQEYGVLYKVTRTHDSLRKYIYPLEKLVHI
jgi:hypothetical protein